MGFTALVYSVAEASRLHLGILVMITDGVLPAASQQVYIHMIQGRG